MLTEGPGWWAGPNWETLVRHAMSLKGDDEAFNNSVPDLPTFRALSICSEHWTRDHCRNGKPPYWLIKKACREARRRIAERIDERDALCRQLTEKARAEACRRVRLESEYTGV